MMKRLVFMFTVGFTLLGGLGVQSAEEASSESAYLDQLMPPGPGPQELEREDADTVGDKNVSDADVEEFLGGFTDPEGNAPQVDPEEVRKWVLATLSVERRVQHPQACQYWIKMENRLPFKIRNMALNFFAYIKDDRYEEPVLFDTAIKSFSELRPTDTQYRDIFFEYADCSKIEYIRVEDAGRCSAGTLTKFSAQSGDCAHLIEIKHSGLVCLHLDKDDADEEGETVVHPCGSVTEADVDALLESLVNAYQAGDADALMGLFNAEVQTDDGADRSSLQGKYSELFADTKSRSMSIASKDWRQTTGGAAEVEYGAKQVIDRGYFWGPYEQQVSGKLSLQKLGDKVVISRYSEQVVSN